MHIALPKQKTFIEQVRPALVALGIFAIGVVLIPVQYPIEVTNGKIEPAIAAPSTEVSVIWTQDWRERCPITVTREFVGADGFKKTAEPFIYGPPAKLGSMAYSGKLTIPMLPPGRAYYHSILQPHCWVDRLWQREYSTPFLPVLVLPPPPPPGPR